MRADTLRGEVGGGGVALETSSFVGPCEIARADRRVLFGAQKRRGRNEGAELEEENKRGGGVQGWRGLNLSMRVMWGSSLGRYVFGSVLSYNKAPPRLPGLGC